MISSYAGFGCYHKLSYRCQAMILVRLLIPFFFILSGCAGPEAGYGPVGWPWPFSPPGQSGRSAPMGAGGGYAQFSFDWQLTGDPEIMPVQVFDDGTSMWLQFQPEGAWPAVFDATAAGWRPLTYRREPPYMVVDGVYEHLELRGGHLRGSISRKGKTVSTAMPSAVAASSAMPPPMAAQPSEAGYAGQHFSVPDSEQTSRSSKEDGQGLAHSLAMTIPKAVEVSSSPADGTELYPDWAAVPGTEVSTVAQAAQVADGAASYLGAPIHRYTVSPADQTIRQALGRWAEGAGWTFTSEHWAVDVDIPLVGAASFETDFKSAVRELLAATELGDRPLQPCFYSNRVLRVVPYAQACDRRSGRGAVS